MKGQETKRKRGEMIQTKDNVAKRRATQIKKKVKKERQDTIDEESK